MRGKYRKMRKIEETFLSCPPGSERLATALLTWQAQSVLTKGDLSLKGLGRKYRGNRNVTESFVTNSNPKFSGKKSACKISEKTKSFREINRIFARVRTSVHYCRWNHSVYFFMFICIISCIRAKSETSVFATDGIWLTF